MNLGIIFPKKLSPQNQATIHLLNNAKDIDLKIHAIKAGEFSHRHKRDVADKRQCELRQEYIDLTPVGEWILVLDTDEMLFGSLDRLADLLRLANENDVDWIGISELLPDWQLKIRPRLIRKREGLQYGGVPNDLGVMHKHDVIAYEGRNYIDLKKTDSSWICDFLGFFHYKNGVEMRLYPQDNVVDMPENMIRIDDL